MKTFLLTLQIILSVAIHAQSEPSKMTTIEHKKSILDISKAIEQNYVFLEKANKVNIELKKNLKNGRYKNALSMDQFKLLVNEDLYKITNDKHLRIVDKFSTEKKNQFQNEFLKVENFGFQEAKILPGNVGYLNIRKFVSQLVAGETAKAAMSFIANTDALIIDLRDNLGGSSDMNQFLLSYFFKGENLPLTKEYFRIYDAYQEVSTLDKVPGKFYDNDIYVLVNSNTYSAAEQFAFLLKSYKRAKIIGEKTGGAANGGKFFDTEKFSVFIPTAHFSFPLDNSTWENIGVEPDIITTDQIKCAQVLAITNLITKFPDRILLKNLIEQLKDEYK